MREGGKFKLTCHVPLSGVHLWFKDGVPIMPNTQNQYLLVQEPPRRGNSSVPDLYVPSTEEHYIIMRLSVEKAEPMHSGEFKCSSFSPHFRRIVVLTGKAITDNKPLPKSHLEDGTHSSP